MDGKFNSMKYFLTKRFHILDKNDYGLYNKARGLEIIAT